jgi:hypothetical protein
MRKILIIALISLIASNILLSCQYPTETVYVYPEPVSAPPADQETADTPTPEAEPEPDPMPAPLYTAGGMAYYLDNGALYRYALPDGDPAALTPLAASNGHRAEYWFHEGGAFYRVLAYSIIGGDRVQTHYLELARMEIHPELQAAETLDTVGRAGASDRWFIVEEGIIHAPPQWFEVSAAGLVEVTP